MDEVFEVNHNGNIVLVCLFISHKEANANMNRVYISTLLSILNWHVQNHI